MMLSWSLKLFSLLLEFKCYSLRFTLNMGNAATVLKLKLACLFEIFSILIYRFISAPIFSIYKHTAL